MLSQPLPSQGPTHLQKRPRVTHLLPTRRPQAWQLAAPHARRRCRPARGVGAGRQAARCNASPPEPTLRQSAQTNKRMQCAASMRMHAAHVMASPAPGCGRARAADNARLQQYQNRRTRAKAPVSAAGVRALMPSLKNERTTTHRTQDSASASTSTSSPHSACTSAQMRRMQHAREQQQPQLKGAQRGPAQAGAASACAAHTMQTASDRETSPHQHLHPPPPKHTHAHTAAQPPHWRRAIRPHAGGAAAAPAALTITHSTRLHAHSRPNTADTGARRQLPPTLQPSTPSSGAGQTRARPRSSHTPTRHAATRRMRLTCSPAARRPSC